MKLNAEGLPSLKPYFLRAFYEWCCDNNYTPLIVVDATKNKDKLQVPREYVIDGQIAFSLDPEAVKDLEMENDHVSFDATFHGVGEHVYVPFKNIKIIFADELKQGLPMEIEETPPKAKPQEKPAPRKKTIFTEVTD
ncbi:MAG: ClpXP protease specificity-enhancing factor SspB [Burkholderiales bacterium]|nr:ClpXP protease specificity-enhancing factor SspB [Burkholderiales bacterium]